MCHKLGNADEQIICSNACEAGDSMANLHSASYLGLESPGLLFKLLDKILLIISMLLTVRAE